MTKKEEPTIKREDLSFVDESKIDGYWKSLSKLSQSDQSKVIDCINMLKENEVQQKEQILRALAESKNLQRRASEENVRLMKYASEDVLKSLLPIIDNFERAIVSGEHNDEISDEVRKYLEGFKMLYGSLIGVLNQSEVTEIEAAGIEFNPNYHQAVITEKDENKPAGVILEVLQKGYMYKDRVIRPAMVKVNE